MSVKSLREALCREQSRASFWPTEIASAVAGVIDMIDFHRPVGADGKHGDLHTATCGCIDGPWTQMTDEAYERIADSYPGAQR